MQTETSGDDGERGLPERALELVEQFLSSRFLEGLSDERREELRENFEVVRRTLIDQRAPRLAIAGSGEGELGELLAAIAGDALPEELEVKEYLGRGRWYDYEIRGVAVEMLDIRRREDDRPSLKALDRESPDIVVFVWEFRDLPDGGEAADEAAAEDPAIEDLEAIVQRVVDSGAVKPNVVAVLDDSRLPEEVTPNRAERVLRSKLRDAELDGARTRIVQRRHVRELDSDLVEMTPLEARMRLARAVQTGGGKRRLARSIIRSSAGIAAAVATIPLPFADIVPITGIQIAMIASIGHLAGRRLSVKTVGEFAAAIGVNVGAGFAFREIVRALVQFVPFAGSVVSSGIAAGATFALGNAAARYFLGDANEEFEAAPERVQQGTWKEVDSPGRE